MKQNDKHILHYAEFIHLLLMFEKGRCEICSSLKNLD